MLILVKEEELDTVKNSKNLNEFSENIKRLQEEGKVEILYTTFKTTFGLDMIMELTEKGYVPIHFAIE